MNFIQMLMRLLANAKQPQQAPASKVGDSLRKTKTADVKTDPNLAMILGSQAGMRNRRDTQGNYIDPGAKTFFQGASGIDAYKEMNRNNTGSSIPGFNSGETPVQRNMGEVAEKLTAYKSQNPNEVITGDAMRRILSNPVARRNPNSVVTTFQPGEKFDVVGRGSNPAPVVSPKLAPQPQIVSPTLAPASKVLPPVMQNQTAGPGNVLPSMPSDGTNLLFAPAAPTTDELLGKVNQLYPGNRKPLSLEEELYNKLKLLGGVTAR